MPIVHHEEEEEQEQEQEEEEELLSFFTHSVHEGEWELAHACVPQLCRSPQHQHHVQNMLRAIITCPYGLKWETVGSPHRLAWFWLKVCERWSSEQVPPLVLRELDFLLLLEELADEVPEAVLKELQQAFVQQQEGRVALSAAAESCVRDLLGGGRTRLAQALAHSLQACMDSEESPALQVTFADFLLHLLERPRPDQSWRETVYRVLAVLPWGRDATGGRLQELYRALWEASAGGVLSEERVLSCLLQPGSYRALSQYCNTALQLYRESMLTHTLATHVELPEAERLMVALCCHSDRASAWKAIYFECLNGNKHFLEQVLMTALDLIRKEEFSVLQDLLAGEFQPLSRLVLLLGWTHCQSLQSARTLLHILHGSQASHCDSILKEFADNLSSQFGVLEWCAQHSPGVPSEALLAQLHSLDSHSPLFILQSLTALAQLEERQVAELLSGVAHSPRSGTASLTEIHSVPVQRNIILFQGFCAMKYALYAICVNAHKCSGCTECVYAMQPAREESAAATLSQGCAALFHYYLSECQLYLEAVPAMFRLELLENIFSLLFLSAADFVHQEQCDEATGAVRGQKGSVDKGEKKGPGLPQSLRSSYVEVAHHVRGCRGFLVDGVAMEGLLRLLRESLEGVCVVGQEDGRPLAGEAEVAETLGCSVTTDTFGARLQRLSKYTAEAQWRLQIVSSNHSSASNGKGQSVSLPSPGPSLKQSRSAGRKKSKKQRPEGLSDEHHNGEVSTGTSDGGVGGGATAAAWVHINPEENSCGGPHTWLVPEMLSPPESLLITCIRRGNFVEAHQVSLMFGLESSACAGELVFMERYRSVLQELAQVEHKMESQVSERAGGGRSRLGSSGRSTLQAIGSAAAAGMAFYSISDVAEKLLSSSGRPVPSLEEGYWLSCRPSDPSGMVRSLLEELSPSSMATFDLACCHCQLWKSSRQLLETAERRLHSTLDSRGLRLDTRAPNPAGILGFPAVLHNISKIINHSVSGKTPAKPEGGGEEPASSGPFSCSIQEVLLCCYPTLTEEAISAHLHLDQQLDAALRALGAAVEPAADARAGGGLLVSLVEQANLKQSEFESHPVRSQMKHLMCLLEQLSQPDAAQVNYVSTFFDYVNTLAAVLVRSLGPDDQTGEVKLGNPFQLLQQTPAQLLTHLIFDRQVSPARVSALLEQEGVAVSVPQVILQRCCDALPLCQSTAREQGVGTPEEVTALLQQYSQEHAVCLGLDPTHTHTTAVPEEPPGPPSPPPSSLLLTPSALTFLKSSSPVLGALAVLSACRGGAVRPPTAWSGLPSYFWGGRKEVVLDVEQASREAEMLLRELPVFHAYLQVMAEPLLSPEEAPAGLAAALCEKPLSSLLLCCTRTRAAQAFLSQAFQQALSSGHVSRALSLLELYGRKCGREEAVRDRLLACAALREGDEGTGHLFRVKDADLRGRVTLEGLHGWPLHACLELLHFCLSDHTTTAPMKQELELKRKELLIYHKMLHLQPPLPCSTWQELKAESVSNTESIFTLMLEAKEFELCGQWMQLYPVPTALSLQLQTQHLLYLLEQGDTEEAFQLLDVFVGSPLGLQICELALDHRPGLSACHFLADFLTLHFEKHMSPARRRHIHCLHLGSKVLLTLPSEVQQDYFPLLSNPLLMLEQLLMNLKVDWASVAVHTLRSLLIGHESSVSPSDIDALLSSYARKALDFPYAPRERSRSDSVISLQEALNQSSSQENCPASPNVETPPSTTSSTPSHTPSERIRRSHPSINFSPPEKPPSRREWVPDHQHAVCMVCQRETFTMFNRRHHCRRCGRLVCHTCSGHRMLVEGCGEEAARVCDQCFRYFNPLCDEGQDEAEVAGGPVEDEESVGRLIVLPEVPQRMYRLSLNVADNQQLHSEFYYEQAPSASLCVAILSLHSDQVACGHQLIEHCHSLSRGLNNPEVDARLITDIMRQLLFSAKLMFVKVGRSQDLALCDSYISKVDVLKILVMANYKYIPSLGDILESAAITRLRNQLLEAEYYQLAVEVSTKSALDPSGVWQAWGMACLKAGNLCVAREKFARCLKAPLDRNNLKQGPRLLQEIIQQLEYSTRSRLSAHGDEDILASLRDLEEALNEPGTLEQPKGRVLNTIYYQECLHYLHMYGTHVATVSFYMRHHGMKEALLYIQSKECAEEVFLEAVLQPSLEQGRLGTLQGLLEGTDPGLESWSRYLMASCQQLQRRSHFHTLYQLQQFMLDHVRAAMTCIRFFTHGAKSYLQLGEQQRWLVRAKEHLRTYLQEQQGRGAGRRRSPSSFRKKMSSSEVSRHMNTIELQLEVTRFLHRCESSASVASVVCCPSAVANVPPTLFGGSPMKAEVACKVMLGGKNIEEGFGIAYRVIQDFQLEALSVYVRAGQRLVRLRQYGAVHQLLKCVSESGTATKNDCDSIVLSCISVADKGAADAKEVESLILQSKTTDNKIKAYLQCSKLRAAYLLAVKLDASRACPLVEEVLRAAESTGDSIMQNICHQWLSEHQQAPGRQQQSRR